MLMWKSSGGVPLVAMPTWAAIRPVPVLYAIRTPCEGEQQYGVSVNLPWVTAGGCTVGAGSETVEDGAAASDGCRKPCCCFGAVGATLGVDPSGPASAVSLSADAELAGNETAD